VEWSGVKRGKVRWREVMEEIKVIERIRRVGKDEKEIEDRV
jgi:hypothetical protein